MIRWDNFELFFKTGVPSEILYPSLLVMMAAIIIGAFNRRIKDKNRYILLIILAEYLLVVIGSTIIFRGHTSYKFDRLELEPFWTYRSVLSQTHGVSVWDIVLNVILFIPLGILVKLLHPSINAFKTIGIALACSLFIEANQYLFERGLTQIDDVMHNVLGAFIGWLLAKIAIQWKTKRDSSILS